MNITNKTQYITIIRMKEEMCWIIRKIINLDGICVCVQVQKCALLKAQSMECEERTRWMNTNAEEIKLQLKHTQQGSSHTVWILSITLSSWFCPDSLKPHVYTSITADVQFWSHWWIKL